MPTRIIIDGHGSKREESFEYTEQELAEQAARTAAGQAEEAAHAAERQALADALANLQPNENSMLVLKAKVNSLLERVRLLEGL